MLVHFDIIQVKFDCQNHKSKFTVKEGKRVRNCWKFLSGKATGFGVWSRGVHEVWEGFPLSSGYAPPQKMFLTF